MSAHINNIALLKIYKELGGKLCERHELEQFQKNAMIAAGQKLGDSSMSNSIALLSACLFVQFVLSTGHVKENIHSTAAIENALDEFRQTYLEIADGDPPSNICSLLGVSFMHLWTLCNPMVFADSTKKNVVVSNEVFSQIFNIENGTVIFLGRKWDVHFKFPNELRISRIHAMFVVLPNGQAYAMDIGSSTGLTVHLKGTNKEMVLFGTSSCGSRRPINIEIGKAFRLTFANAGLIDTHKDTDEPYPMYRFTIKFLSPPKDVISNLPIELWFVIFEHLDTHDVLRLLIVSKRLNVVASSFIKSLFAKLILQQLK